MIPIDRRTLFAAATAAGALPARCGFAQPVSEVLDMTSTYPHYAAAIGFGRARCEAPADDVFGT